MASTTSTVQVIFDGTVAGLQRAARAAERALEGVNRAAKPMAKALTGLAAGGAAIQTIAGIAAAAQQLLPAALVLPGALLAAGAAFATLKIGLDGFKAALATADPAAFAEATKDMAPAAVAAAVAIRAMAPAWKEVQQSVQQALFTGIAEPIAAIGATYLPILKTGLTGIATEFSVMAVNAATALQAPRVQTSVATVLSHTRELLANMPNALANVSTGFINLGAIGSSYLPGLGTAIENVSAKFAGWVADNPAKIRAMIDHAMQGFRDLGVIVGDVGSIIGSIFSGLSAGAGQTFLASLRETTTAVAAFMQTAAAQAPLQALGETMRVAGSALRDILLAALTAVGPIIVALAPLVQSLATSIGTALTGALAVLGPPLATLATALTTALAPILPVIAQAFVALATALAPVITALAPVVASLGTSLLPVIQQLLPIITQTATIIGEALVSAINAVAPAIPPVVAAIGQILAAVAPLLPQIAELAKTLLPVLADIFVAVVVPAVQLVASVITGVLVPILAKIIADVQQVANVVRTSWDAIKNFTSTMVGGVQAALAWFNGLPGMFQQWWEGARAAVVAKAGEMVAWVQGLPGRIKAALGSLGTLLVSAGRDLVNGLWNGIKAGWTFLTTQVSNLAKSLLGTAKSALGIASPSTLFRDEVGYQIPTGTALGIDAATPHAVAASQRMADATFTPFQDSIKRWGDAALKAGQVIRYEDGSFKPKSEFEGRMDRQSTGVNNLEKAVGKATDYIHFEDGSFAKRSEYENRVDNMIQATNNLFESARRAAEALGFARENVKAFEDGSFKIRTEDGSYVRSDYWGGPRYDNRRAMGGPVHSGRSYLVGERGPEVLTMGGRGHVTPNHELGGGDTYVTVMIDGQEFRGMVQTEISERNRSTRRAALAGTGRRA